MDPIISPGNMSQHLHHIVGASGFNQNYDPIKIRQSKCTSLGVEADMSNYWQPAVMKVLNDGSYASMRTNTRIYYHTPRLAKGAKVEPFPFDYQMIGGSPSRKNFDNRNQEHLATLYYCEVKDSKGRIIKRYDTHALPKEACSLLISKVFFPTCWNGKPFKLGGTPNAVYPKHGGGVFGPNCPKGYERRIPGILMEVWHFEANQPATKSTNRFQYILGNGDTTGYGLHADFANGWDMTILNRVLSECKRVPIEEPPNKACAALAASYDRRKGDQCSIEGMIPNEKVGAKGEPSIKYLPGCNLPWSTGAKPSCDSTVFKGNPGWIRPSRGKTWP
ncbi:hypothetical protein P389DRAFT_207648 [Cystobasidium minutum MCA 4210]|uniref:uncharacterized protein n=1 Tax=Cystobasidium minutum MCA 4210 TaxID=1397322 RepID=UPI0034D00401|eukprot:jgi/Rhomi1/207648/estExt_Genemark1.C_1_t20088